MVMEDGAIRVMIVGNHPAMRLGIAANILL